MLLRLGVPASVDCILCNALGVDLRTWGWEGLGSGVEKVWGCRVQLLKYIYCTISSGNWMLLLTD